MTLNFDVSGDYVFFDWEDTITYYQRTSDTTYANAQTITHCLHRQEDKTIEKGDEWDLITQYTTWEIWSDNVDFTPIRGDKIIDAQDRTWMVETIDYCDRISRYRLKCFNPTQGKNE